MFYRAVFVFVFLSLSGFLNFWPSLSCRVWVASQKFKLIQRSGDITTMLATKLAHVLPQKAQNNETSQHLNLFFYRIFSKEESNFGCNVFLGRHDVLRWKCNKVANILCRVYLLVCKFASIAEKICLSYFCELDTRTKVLTQLTNLRRDRPKRLVNRFLIQYHAIVVTCSTFFKAVLRSTQKIVWENNFGCEGFLQIAADIYLTTMDLGR